MARLSYCTGPDLVAETIIARFPNHCSDAINKPIKMTNGYWKKTWEVLKEEMKCTFHHLDAPLYM
jgi:hypothetical protein